ERGAGRPGELGAGELLAVLVLARLTVDRTALLHAGKGKQAAGAPDAGGHRLDRLALDLVLGELLARLGGRDLRATLGHGAGELVGEEVLEGALGSGGPCGAGRSTADRAGRARRGAHGPTEQAAGKGRHGGLADLGHAIAEGVLGPV